MVAAQASPHVACPEAHHIGPEHQKSSSALEFRGNFCRLAGWLVWGREKPRKWCGEGEPQPPCLPTGGSFSGGWREESGRHPPPAGNPRSSACQTEVLPLSQCPSPTSLLNKTEKRTMHGTVSFFKNGWDKTVFSKCFSASHDSHRICIQGN